MLSDLSQSLLKLEVGCLVRLSEAARGARETQIALNSVIRAQHLDQEGLFEIADEFASVLWEQGEQRLAVEFLKKELQQRERSAAPRQTDEKVQHACILARLVSFRLIICGVSSDYHDKGEWTSEACLEKPEFIQENYFVPAIRLMEDPSASTSTTTPFVSETKSVVFYKFALFAEQQFKAIIHSDEIVRFKVYTERKKQEVTTRQESVDRANASSKKHYQTQLEVAQKLLKQDTENYEQVTQSRDAFLLQAIRMLSFALATSDAYDGDASIRMCSLWFSNFKTSALDNTINAALERVPSRKLVFLAHQLSARLTNSDNVSVNQGALQTLVLRMGNEHPFHSLYQVYTLQSLDAGNRRSSGVTNETFSQHERASAASDIFDRLLSVSGSANRVRDLKHLCDAYLEWAKYKVKANTAFEEKVKRKESCKVPGHLKIRKISSMRVPVTTSHTQLDPTMCYDNCVWIEGYADQFDTAGGLSLPKISYCKGSDGTTYKQLVRALRL